MAEILKQGAAHSRIVRDGEKMKNEIYGERKKWQASIFNAAVINGLIITASLQVEGGKMLGIDHCLDNMRVLVDAVTSVRDRIGFKMCCLQAMECKELHNHR